MEVLKLAARLPRDHYLVGQSMTVEKDTVIVFVLLKKKPKKA